MFPVRRCVAPSWFQNQPHAKRAWKPSKTLLKMRESCTFSNQIFHVVLVFFFHATALSESIRLTAHVTWLMPTSPREISWFNSSWSNDSKKKPRQWSHVLKRRVQNKTTPNREILQPPRPYCEPLNFVWIVITRCRCMSMWQSIVHVCSNVGNLTKEKMLKTFHLETVESSGITKLTGICNVDATNCSYIVQTRPKYSGWFHVSKTATTRPMRFKLHSKMFSKSALPVVHFSSKIRCWLFTKKHMKKNLGVASTQNIESKKTTIYQFG